MVDLNADIVPGISAAGFQIGQRFDEVQASDLNNCVVRTWTRDREESLSEAVAATEGWLLCDTFLFFSRGTVQLQFNAVGVLYCIAVWEKYSGRFANAVQIGDRLDKVLPFTDIFHDSGDEAHYPVEESPIRGIAFYAEDTPLENSPDQVIRGFSVQDWSLQ